MSPPHTHTHTIFFFFFFFFFFNCVSSSLYFFFSPPFRCLNLISALAQLFFLPPLFREPILPHPRLHPLHGGNLQQRRRERGRGVHSEGDRGDISTGWAQNAESSISAGAWCAARSEGGEPPKKRKKKKKEKKSCSSPFPDIL